jgi:hypothetical protein
LVDAAVLNRDGGFSLVISSVIPHILDLLGVRRKAAWLIWPKK